MLRNLHHHVDVTSIVVTVRSEWIPVTFSLREGLPFTYSDRAISVISGTEAFRPDCLPRSPSCDFSLGFRTGIDTCDFDRLGCIVCGEEAAPALEHIHIVPRVERHTVRLSYNPPCACVDSNFSNGRSCAPGNSFLFKLKPLNTRPAMAFCSANLIIHSSIVFIITSVGYRRYAKLHHFHHYLNVCT
jgi:hypothetical protein